MEALLFILASIAGLALIKIHERVVSKAINKRLTIAVALLLGFAICYGGSKGDLPDPPTPPDPPDEPDEPIVENVSLKLIGRVNEEGNFVPLTSEWVKITTTNGVIEIEQIEELIDE